MTVISIGLSQSCLHLLRQGWGSACPLDNTGRTAVWATVHEFPTALRLSEPGALAEASPSRDGLIQIQERNIYIYIYSKKVSETFINISQKLILRTNHYFESLPTTPAQSPTLPRDHKSSNRFGLEKHGHPLEKRRWNVLKSDLEREKWHRFRWSDGLQMGCTLSEMILRIL